MIVGVGTDLIENERIEKLYERFKERLLKRLFIDEEINYCLLQKNFIPHLSARFALKEAFIKALGLPRDLRLSYKEVGLVGTKGKKNIVVNGVLKSKLDKAGVKKINFSIAHEKRFSTAIVILEK